MTAANALRAQDSNRRTYRSLYSSNGGLSAAARERAKKAADQLIGQGERVRAENCRAVKPPKEVSSSHFIDRCSFGIGEHEFLEDEGEEPDWNLLEEECDAAFESEMALLSGDYDEYDKKVDDRTE